MRRKHITAAAIPQNDLENLYALVDSLDELARALEPRAMSADARYLLTDLQKELEDAMLERGLPLFNESLADHIPLVCITNADPDDDEDTRPTLFADPEAALNQLWSIAIGDAFGDTVDNIPSADDDADEEATAS